MRDQIQVKAESIGFDLFGVTDCSSPDMQYYRTWLSEGLHGEMHYLERHLPLKADPTTLLPEARSLIVVACNYYRPDLPLAPEATEVPYRVARYARGDDYHVLMKEMLNQLVTALREDVPELKARVFVDSGPLLERELARRAGLGWFGKNTCLIHPQKGSWFLLGCLLSDLELPPDQPFERFHCGNCTRCLEACPTQALVEPHKLDATRCLSYWNIEQRETIPEAYREAMGDWLFGCDICQEVCPWNQRFARSSPLDAFAPRDWLQQRPLRELVNLSAHDFELQIAPRSPLKRPKYRGFIRNVAVVLGNRGQSEDLPALQQALERHAEDPMLRSHLDWASKRIQNGL